MTLLSICIPTFNRPSCLREAIQSVLESCQGLDETIDILVSDNGSEEATQRVIGEFSDIKNLRYFRNDRNLGIFDNYFLATERALGRYVWLLGDDDKLSKRAIAEVLSQIKLERDLIVCNFSIWSKDFSNKRSESAFTFQKDRIFRTPEEVFTCFGLALGYISSVVMKKDLVLSIPKEKCEKFRWDGFPLLFSIYASLPSSCNVQYLATPLVCNRADNSEGYDWHRFFIEGSSKIFRALKECGFSIGAIKHAKNLVIFDYICPNIVGLKLEKRWKVKILFLLFKHYWRQRIFWTLCLPFSLTPFFVINRNQTYYISRSVILKRELLGPG